MNINKELVIVISIHTTSHPVVEPHIISEPEVSTPKTTTSEPEQVNIIHTIPIVHHSTISIPDGQGHDDQTGVVEVVSISLFLVLVVFAIWCIFGQNDKN